MTKSVFSRPYQVLIEELIAARKAAEMTQQQVADALGKPQSFVAKYENGERRLDVVEFLLVLDAVGILPDKIISTVRKNL